MSIYKDLNGRRVWHIPYLDGQILLDWVTDKNLNPLEVERKLNARFMGFADTDYVNRIQYYKFKTSARPRGSL